MKIDLLDIEKVIKAATTPMVMAVTAIKARTIITITNSTAAYRK